MKMTNEFQLIRDWAEEKGIFLKGDVKTQYVKLQEEAGELAKAIIKNDKDEFIDALGDCTIVLVNLAKLGGYNLEDCINSAYNVIINRQGKMINGSFVKNK
jgi:NTP pyrophosphatase (non-canonical NTP hydrolase)